MTSCLICRSAQVERVLDLGRQPVSSHFGTRSDAAAKRHPLALAACRDCGVVQLTQPVPHADLVPPFDWITYREPETHLDRVLDCALALDGLHRGASIVGLSFKDATTLERFRKNGFTHVRSIDAQAELGARKADAGVRSIRLCSLRNGRAKSQKHTARPISSSPGISSSTRSARTISWRRSARCWRRADIW